jgi:hypothetical protein
MTIMVIQPLMTAIGLKGANPINLQERTFLTLIVWASVSCFSETVACAPAHQTRTIKLARK